MRVRLTLILLAVSGLLASAATLQQLSLDDMIAQSTAIVRAHVIGASASRNGRVIYTHYKLQVTDQLKGASTPQLDVATPGGTANGITQIFPGSPMLAAGQDYVLFLWTSRSGLVQIIGLSQGLFTAFTDASGQSAVTRPAASEVMLDRKTGAMVQDHALRMRLSDLKTHIRRTLAGAGGGFAKPGGGLAKTGGGLAKTGGGLAKK